MSGPQLTRKDSARIYIEILKLEQERQEAIIAAAAAAQAARLEDLKNNPVSLAVENEVGKKFLAKVMARRKQRKQDDDLQAQALAVPEKEKERELFPPVHPYPIREKPPAKDLSKQGDPKLMCPQGLGPLKKASEFTMKFTPPECCGGPRLVDILNSTDRILLTGTIDSDTEAFLRKPGAEEEDPNMMTLKADERNETGISFPDLENVAFICKPKKLNKISSQQQYEIDSGEGYSNHFNFGIEVITGGSPRKPEYIFKMVNPNLVNVATIILLSDYKTAEVAMDENLWPSQKAVILATAFYMIWETVQEIRRKASYIKSFAVICVVIVLLFLLLLLITYDWSGDEGDNIITKFKNPPPTKKPPKIATIKL